MPTVAIRTPGAGSWRNGSGLPLLLTLLLPLCTNEGSGMGSSERDIAKACPDAKVAKGLSVTGSHAASAKPQVEKWLKANRIL